MIQSIRIVKANAKAKAMAKAKAKVKTKSNTKAIHRDFLGKSQNGIKEKSKCLLDIED